MINYKIVIWLLFCHWVADFVCQSDYVAQNKSKNNIVLTIHCFIYGIIVGLGALIAHCKYAGAFYLLNALIHFPVDYVTSRINSKLWADKKVHWFFVSIGFDQWIHFVTIILVWRLLSP